MTLAFHFLSSTGTKVVCQLTFISSIQHQQQHVKLYVKKGKYLQALLKYYILANIYIRSMSYVNTSFTPLPLYLLKVMSLQ